MGASSPDDWQPADTAPRDGRTFIGYLHPIVAEQAGICIELLRWEYCDLTCCGVWRAQSGGFSCDEGGLAFWRKLPPRPTNGHPIIHPTL